MATYLLIVLLIFGALTVGRYFGRINSRKKRQNANADHVRALNIPPSLHAEIHKFDSIVVDIHEGTGITSGLTREQIDFLKPLYHQVCESYLDLYDGIKKADNSKISDQIALLNEMVDDLHIQTDKFKAGEH